MREPHRRPLARRCTGARKRPIRHIGISRTYLRVTRPQARRAGCLRGQALRRQTHSSFCPGSWLRRVRLRGAATCPLRPGVRHPDIAQIEMICARSADRDVYPMPINIRQRYGCFWSVGAYFARHGGSFPAWPRGNGLAAGQRVAGGSRSLGRGRACRCAGAGSGVQARRLAGLLRPTQEQHKFGSGRGPTREQHGRNGIPRHTLARVLKSMRQPNYQARCA